MTLLPSRQAAIRANIVAAILALPDWPLDVPVEKLGIPSDAFHMGHRTMVGVCLTDDAWRNLDEGLDDPLDHEAEMEVQIVVYSTSEASPTGALEPDDGNIDGLVGLILGSNRPGYGPGLRSADVGAPFDVGAVRCRAVRTQLMAEQKRAEGSGGALAKIIMMRTTALPL
jgi:hypothetical protein